GNTGSAPATIETTASTKPTPASMRGMTGLLGKQAFLLGRLYLDDDLLIGLDAGALDGVRASRQADDKIDFRRRAQSEMGGRFLSRTIAVADGDLLHAQ